MGWNGFNWLRTGISGEYVSIQRTYYKEKPVAHETISRWYSKSVFTGQSRTMRVKRIRKTHIFPVRKEAQVTNK